MILHVWHSSFFWLISIMLPSILYGLVPELKASPAGTLVLSVLCQEFGRFCFVKLYFYSENALIKKTDIGVSPFNDWSMAISAGMRESYRGLLSTVTSFVFDLGVGFGLMSSLVMYGGEFGFIETVAIVTCA